MGITIKCYVGAPGNRGASLFPEGRTYSPPAKAGGGSPPVGRARALFTKCLSAASPEGGRQCRKRALPVQLAAIFCLNIKTVVTTSQLPAKTCYRQLCRRYGYRCSGDPHFLFAKKKQKRREGENKWQSTIWKQKWSAGAMGVLLLPLPPI